MVQPWLMICDPQWSMINDVSEPYLALRTCWKEFGKYIWKKLWRLFLFNLRGYFRSQSSKHHFTEFLYSIYLIFYLMINDHLFLKTWLRRSSFFKILTNVQRTRANVMRRQIVQILLDLIVAHANKDMKEMELIALVIL